MLRCGHVPEEEQGYSGPSPVSGRGSGDPRKLNKEGKIRDYSHGQYTGYCCFYAKAATQFQLMF